MVLSAAERERRRDGGRLKAMSRRIYLTASISRSNAATGIATYTRKLAQIVRGLGFEVGVVYSSPRRPARNPLRREISFLNTRDAAPVAYPKKVWDTHLRSAALPFGLKPSTVGLTGTTIADQLRDRLPLHDHLFVARNLFANARRYFSWSGRFIELNFDTAPDILHCTYQLPLRAKRARNVYTIHDLVPLRLPYATLDNKRQTYSLLRKIAAEADHIVTVSEHSKRDIVQLLGVEEERVTNTYEAVEFPRELTELPDDVMAERLRCSYGLDLQGYLLFLRCARTEEECRAADRGLHALGANIPLVITGAGGWGNQAELEMIEELQAEGRAQGTRRICRVEYVSFRCW